MKIKQLESEKGSKNPFMNRKGEKEFLALSNKYSKQFIHAHNNSNQEGFEYFYSTMKNPPTRKNFISKLWHVGDGKGFFGRLKLIKKMIGNFRTIMKGMKQSFIDLEEYYHDLRKFGNIKSHNESNLISNYPNTQLWKELLNYADIKWRVKIGFTKLPSQLIFQNKAVLFDYALVCIQEMQKDMIDQAPNTITGVEVMRVYGSLGIAVNDIAQWLRAKGILCQANHPLGGLVSTPPLAGKAGMGWIGRHGLLITPDYGPRHRIAPIFINQKTFEFTDNEEHRWIEKWCKTCGKCQRECPTEAIKSEKQISIPNVPGIGYTRTSIDREKCFPYFNETFGCSVCIKVCPFSNGNKTYKKLKKVIENRN